MNPKSKAPKTGAFGCFFEKAPDPKGASSIGGNNSGMKKADNRTKVGPNYEPRTAAWRMLRLELDRSIDLNAFLDQ